MRAIITADIHLGLKGKTRDIMWALRTMMTYAQRNDIELVFVLGDLFDDRERLDVDVINETYNFFQEVRSAGQQWIIFPGNHDMFLKNSWEINSIRFLHNIATIVEDIKLLSIEGHRFWILPFIYYEDVYMKALSAIEEHYQQDDYLLTHVGTHNASLNECFMIKHWSIVEFNNSKFDRVYAGHFHCQQQVGENLWYPGSPLPYRFDEGLVSHGFYDLDVDKREHKFIEIFEEGPKLCAGDLPPDFVTILDDDVDDVQLTYPGSNVRVFLSREYTQQERLILVEKLRQKGASRVKCVRTKEEEIDISNSQNKHDISISNSKDLLRIWYEHDKPASIDYELLEQLNTIIINKAEVRGEAET